jgi:hypothetical protein
VKALLGGILFLALFVAPPASAQVYPLPNSTTCQPGYYFVPADNLCYPPGYGYNPFYSYDVPFFSFGGQFGQFHHPFHHGFEDHHFEGHGGGHFAGRH